MAFYQPPRKGEACIVHATDRPPFRLAEAIRMAEQSSTTSESSQLEDDNLADLSRCQVYQLDDVSSVFHAAILLWNLVKATCNDKPFHYLPTPEEATADLSAGIPSLLYNFLAWLVCGGSKLCDI